jgi:hypothetical protein
MDGLVALEKRVEALHLTPGPQGDPGAKGEVGEPGTPGVPGERGKDGVNGTDGAGIDAPQWVEGAVYRKDTVVVANLGQHFRALKDTASSPDDPDHWQRVGSGGFRHRGEFKADALYLEGDLFLKDFGTFLVTRAGNVVFAGRGSVGKTGEPGARGAPGRDGRDGGTIIGAQVDGFKLVLVQQDTDGAIDHIEADFGPAIREMVREELERLLGGPA